MTQLSSELPILLRFIRDSKPTTTSEVQTALEKYFAGVQWSLLKEEYENYMTFEEKIELVKRLTQDVLRSE